MCAGPCQSVNANVDCRIMAKKKSTSKPDDLASVQAKLKAAADASEMTQQQIGERMGYSEASARKAVSRLLSGKENDPRLSTLLAFAKAIDKKLADIL